MKAIVKISGKQFRVAKGERVVVDRLANQVGDSVTFEEVLMLTDGAKASIGTPIVEGAAVTARVLAATRGPKLIVYKYKAKKRYRRTQGARAELSVLEVVSVTGPNGQGRAAKPAKVEVEKPATALSEKPAKMEAQKPSAKAEVKKPAVKAAVKKPAGKAEAKTPSKAKKPSAKAEKE